MKIKFNAQAYKPASEFKLEWQCPTIKRIDIKRTMGGAGSNSDGSAFTN